MEFIVKYWLEFLFSLVIAFIGYVAHKLGRYYKTIETSVTGVRVLLKTRIIEEYNHVKQAQCISMYQKQTILELYQEYKKLGGNGLIDDIMEQIDNIPISKD